MLNSIPSTRENFAREKFQFICIAGKKSKIFNFDKCHFFLREKGGRRGDEPCTDPVAGRIGPRREHTKNKNYTQGLLGDR